MKTMNLSLASLALAASVLLAGACATDLPAEPPGSSLTQLSNGPNLPDECNVCWDDFQECFAQGNDLAECGFNIVSCTDQCQAPPPPAECLHCAAGFDACVNAAAANGATGEDCAAGFEGCLFACESDCDNSATGCLPTCDDPANGQVGDPTNGDCQPIEPPIDECGQCDADFNQCFDDLWQDQSNSDPAEAVQICEEAHFQCFDNCTGGGGGGWDDCAQAFEQCLNDTAGTPDGQNFHCEEILDQCATNTPPGGQDSP